MATIASLSAPSPIRVVAIESQPFGENTYVVFRDGSESCLVIDPGFEPGAIITWLEETGLHPEAILVTHGHSDHIAGIGSLRTRWPEIPIVIGRGDAPKLTSPTGNLSAGFGLALVAPPADRLLDDGETFRGANLDLVVREIPGHSSGHVAFVIDAVEPPIVFGGDVLFREGIGRTDFPDGDFSALEAGIRRHLYSLPDAAIVFPGHGVPTTVGYEKSHNPFVRPGGAR